MSESVYVAGSTRDTERVNIVQAVVRACGGRIAFDWTGPEGEIRDTGRDAAAAKGAAISQREIEACRTADLVIVLCPPAGLGCWIEMGAALASDVEVWVVEPHRDSVFWQHPLVRRFATFAVLLNELRANIGWDHSENWPRPTEAQAHRALRVARERGWVTDCGWIWEAKRDEA